MKTHFKVLADFGDAKYHIIPCATYRREDEATLDKSKITCILCIAIYDQKPIPTIQEPKPNVIEFFYKTQQAQYAQEDFFIAILDCGHWLNSTSNQERYIPCRNCSALLFDKEDSKREQDHEKESLSANTSNRRQRP